VREFGNKIDNPSHGKGMRRNNVTKNAKKITLIFFAIKKLAENKKKLKKNGPKETKFDTKKKRNNDRTSSRCTKQPNTS